MNYYNIIIEPLITEKSETLRALHNRVVFLVNKDSNCKGIKTAVEKIFNVKVKKVNTLNIKGKRKRFGQRIGKKSDYKKAYIDLMPGSHIELFEGI